LEAKRLKLKDDIAPKKAKKTDEMDLRFRSLRGRAALFALGRFLPSELNFLWCHTDCLDIHWQQVTHKSE
jgi:hypothetical protein